MLQVEYRYTVETLSVVQRTQSILLLGVIFQNSFSLCPTENIFIPKKFHS